MGKVQPAGRQRYPKTPSHESHRKPRGPNVSIGKGTRVTGSTIRNTVIGDDCVITGSALHDSMLGNAVLLTGVNGSMTLGDNSEFSAA